MDIGEPPKTSDVLNMKKYLMNIKKAIYSQENIAFKLKYIKFIESIFLDSTDEIKSLLYDGLFTMLLDINPPVRKNALNVLSTTAFIPQEWVTDSLSKGENVTDSFPEKPYVGMLGMCLADPYPEIRAAAVEALANSIVKSDDPHAKEVLASVTQLLSDASNIVRTAAIEGSYKISSLVGDLVQLEESQLGLVTSVIYDAVSSSSDRSSALKFISQLSVTSVDQARKINDDLNSAVDKCKWNKLITTAYNFGRNNSTFQRILAINYQAKNFEVPNFPLLSFQKKIIRSIIFLGAYDDIPFPLNKNLQMFARSLMPIIVKLREKYKSSHIIKESDKAIDLNYLENIISTSTLDQRETQILNPQFNDACDYLSGRYPPELFKNISINDSQNIITRYRCKIRSPIQNTKYTAFDVSHKGNFFLEIKGEITPYPNDLNIIVVIDTMLNESFYDIPTIFPDGSFKADFSIKLPCCVPFIKLLLTVKIGKNGIDYDILDKPYEFWMRGTENQ